jgi:hypothetical protein
VNNPAEQPHIPGMTDREKELVTELAGTDAIVIFARRGRASGTGFSNLRQINLVEIAAILGALRVTVEQVTALIASGQPGFPMAEAVDAAADGVRMFTEQNGALFMRRAGEGGGRAQ